MASEGFVEFADFAEFVEFAEFLLSALLGLPIHPQQGATETQPERLLTCFKTPHAPPCTPHAPARTRLAPAGTLHALQLAEEGFVEFADFADFVEFAEFLLSALLGLPIRPQQGATETQPERLLTCLKTPHAPPCTPMHPPAPDWHPPAPSMHPNWPKKGL